MSQAWITDGDQAAAPLPQSRASECGRHDRRGNDGPERKLTRLDVGTERLGDDEDPSEHAGQHDEQEDRKAHRHSLRSFIGNHWGETLHRGINVITVIT